MKLATRKLAVIGMLGGISIMLGISGMGIIRIPFLPVEVTIMHIPTIIGAIVEGPMVGLFVGLIFGAFSMYQAFAQPAGIAIAFMDPLVSILPRLLIPLVAYYSFRGIKSSQRIKGKKKLAIASAIAAALGTLTNTIGVLGMAFLRYKHIFAEIFSVDQSVVGKAILYLVVIPNGIPEMIFAILVITPIIQALNRFYNNGL